MQLALHHLLVSIELSKSLIGQVKNTFHQRRVSHLALGPKAGAIAALSALTEIIHRDRIH
jgi:hypothetical protein